MWLARINHDEVVNKACLGITNVLPLQVLDYSDYSEVSVLPKTFKVADLSKDILFTRVWSYSRFQKNIVSLQQHSFRQTNNHQITYYRYLDCFSVENGNHSIFAGMMMSQGLVIAHCEYDMTLYLKYLDTDGTIFTHVASNKKICNVDCWEQAAIFKISKIAYLSGYRIPEDLESYDETISEPITK